MNLAPRRHRPPASRVSNETDSTTPSTGSRARTTSSAARSSATGSSAVAGVASAGRGGSGLIERVRMAPYARVAIQMGIAVGGAIVAGDALSGRRFYWAVIAAFITFMGTSTAGEQPVRDQPPLARLARPATARRRSGSDRPPGRPRGHRPGHRLAPPQRRPPSQEAATVSC